MGDPRGFLKFERITPARRPVEVRVHDWHEVYLPFGRQALETQAARCMDCGIPFCHEACPLGNLIPEWNDLVQRDRMAEAVTRLEATNNFPEFTGRLCPAPCEGSCVLAINADPVAIKVVELEIAEFAASSGSLEPATLVPPSGRRVAVVGSGPAGLAAAQQLTRAGHAVVVYERAERPGGLLRYGIPEFKLEKRVLELRLEQMVAEGTRFECEVAVGGDGAIREVPGAAAPHARVVALAALRAEFDAVLLATGATRPRDLAVEGRNIDGVHFAMDYLKASNLACEGSARQPAISASNKHVVIVGGGDTGADCLGTVHRQGAASVVQLEILPAPPETRAASNPWPTWPVVMRTSSAHEEGGERRYAVETVRLAGDAKGALTSLRLRELAPPGTSATTDAESNTETELRADLLLLAMGFVGTERDGVVAEARLDLDARGNIAVDGSFATSAAGVFACGDAVRGQSLIVWAIAEGRSAARGVDSFLTGSSELPAPIVPGQRALV